MRLLMPMQKFKYDPNDHCYGTIFIGFIGAKSKAIFFYCDIRSEEVHFVEICENILMFFDGSKKMNRSTNDKALSQNK